MLGEWSYFTTTFAGIYVRRKHKVL